MYWHGYITVHYGQCDVERKSGTFHLNQTGASDKHKVSHMKNYPLLTKIRNQQKLEGTEGRCYVLSPTPSSVSVKSITKNPHCKSPLVLYARFYISYTP